MIRPALGRTFVLLVVAAFSTVSAAAESFSVFRSSDGGQSWTRADAGMPGDSRINAFGSANEVLFAGTDSGIFISQDEGLRWQPATVATLPSDRILAFATLGQKVFAGTGGHGMWMSLDGGRSWGRHESFPSRKVRCLLAHDGKLYAGTDAEGVFKSIDAGQTWTRLSPGLPSQEQVFALAAAQGQLFAALYSRGLYAWDESKRTWVKRGAVTPLTLASTQGTLVAGHNPGGLHWSADQGASWSRGVRRGLTDDWVPSLLPDNSGELPAQAPVWDLAADDHVVLAGALDGIFYSGDAGRTWTRARQGLPASSPGIAFLLHGHFVLAGVRIEGQP